MRDNSNLRRIEQRHSSWNIPHAGPSPFYDSITSPLITARTATNRKSDLTHYYCHSIYCMRELCNIVRNKCLIVIYNPQHIGWNRGCYIHSGARQGRGEKSCRQSCIFLCHFCAGISCHFGHHCLLSVNTFLMTIIDDAKTYCLVKWSPSESQI